MRWLGLEWDEGPITADATGPSKGKHGPYFQSQRREQYREAGGGTPARGWIGLRQEGAIKFKMTREPITIPDLVVGNVTREPTDREALDPDFVIVRSDGQPVFHFVNVVDDLEMEITHVIRGEDHLSNTPKHIALFRAFGVAPPNYAHIPLILNADGTKMSKRDKGASLTTYIEEGYAPEAVVNYLCLLGWSPKGGHEKMSLLRCAEAFDLPQILRHNARFDFTKLQWLNGEYIRHMHPDRFHELAVHALARAGSIPISFPLPYVKAALDTCKEKVKTLLGPQDFCDFYFVEEISEYDREAAKKDFVPENKPRLARLRDAFANLAALIRPPRKIRLRVAQELGIKAGILVHPTRLACTGRSIGPSLYHLMAVLGKDRVLQRLNRAVGQME